MILIPIIAHVQGCRFHLDIFRRFGSGSIYCDPFRMLDCKMKQQRSQTQAKAHDRMWTFKWAQVDSNKFHASVLPSNIEVFVNFFTSIVLRWITELSATATSALPFHSCYVDSGVVYMVLVRFFAKPVVPSPKNSWFFLHKMRLQPAVHTLKHVAFLGSESWWVWIFMVQLWGMWVNVTSCCKVMLMFGSSPVCSTWIPNPIPDVDVRIFQLNLEWTCHVNHCSFADSQKWTFAKFNATRDFERFLKGVLILRKLFPEDTMVQWK